MIVGVEWREIPGADGYYACSDGSIWSARRGALKPLRQRRNRHGYLCVNIYAGSKPGTTTHSHALIARAFHGEPPPNSETCHINGIRDDNRPSNLRWGTRRDNSLDRWGHGTMLTGHCNPATRLSLDQALLAKSLVGKKSDRMVAAMLGVSRRCIQSLRVGETWAWLKAGDA